MVHTKRLWVKHVKYCNVAKFHDWFEVLQINVQLYPNIFDEIIQNTESRNVFV